MWEARCETPGMHIPLLGGYRCGIWNMTDRSLMSLSRRKTLGTSLRRNDRKKNYIQNKACSTLFLKKRKRKSHDDRK